MIGFIDRYNGGALNIDAIERLGPRIEVLTSRGKEKRFPVFFKGGGGQSSVEMSEHCLRSMFERPVQLLPAEPGARLLSAGLENGEYYCHSTALVAWALCLDGFIRPVTPAGVDDGSSEPDNGWWVELPSGGIYDTGADAMTIDDREELERVIRARAEKAS